MALHPWAQTAKSRLTASFSLKSPQNSSIDASLSKLVQISYYSFHVVVQGEHSVSLSSESEEVAMGRAIEYRRFGGPEVLEEVERPTQAPGDGEVRIAVRAVGLNPLDFKTFEGDLRPVERVQRLIHPRRWLEGASSRFPRGVARDFAGVIDAVGTNVTDLAVGDAVLGTLRSALARPTPAERSPPSWWHPPTMSSRSQPRCHSRKRPVWVLPRKPRAAHSDS